VKGINHLVEIFLDGRIILEWILKIGYGGVDWFRVAQYRIRS
jgi:hypothetical protein